MVHKLNKGYPIFQTEAHEPYPKLNGRQIRRARGLSIPNRYIYNKCNFLSFLPANCIQLRHAMNISKALFQVLYSYKLFTHLDISLMPPNVGASSRSLLITPKKSWRDPHQHLLILEVQDQTVSNPSTADA